jgi:F-type H+-transporting ATPase subunit epsilon
MADTFLLEIATPDRRLVHEPVLEAQIPAAGGYLGVLPGHAPLLGQLGIGELQYKLQSGQVNTVLVAGGYVEVAQQHVRVLADVCENANEIDVARAEAALKRASERMSQIDGSVDVGRAINAVRRAQERLALAHRYGKKSS